TEVMNASASLQLSAERSLAYHKLNAQGDGSRLPGLIFLGGFKSDMNGTKARFLHDWAEARGLAFVRFDYRGHGESSGRFEDGCIGEWADDAGEVLHRLSDGPQVLIGSSMGGWLALLLARMFPQRIAGLVGIAAAPDFTTRRWSELPAEIRQTIQRDGRIEVPSEYDEAPYVYTHRLFEDGERHQVRDKPLPLPFPVRLLHGTADPDVPYQVSVELIEHITCDDARLVLVKDGDHRLSSESDLRLLGKTVHSVLKAGSVS
ncbi:MAG: alpha/beta hydrolase, partial [Pseudomonadota bacterium]